MAGQNKLAAFFITEKGKLTSGVLAFTALSAGVLAKYLPNSFLLDQTQEFLQLFKNGMPARVPADSLQLVEQAKADLKLEENVSKRISAFTVFGFDILHIGSSSYDTGARIGIPVNFSYTLPIKDADRKDILVGQKTVHWTTPEGLALESSIVLSDSAKKFAIAREIAKSTTNHVTTLSALNGFTIAAYYYMTRTFNRKANLFARPRKIRMTIYTLLGGMVFTTWLFLKDFLTYRWEESADDQVANLSNEYAKGALEFYSKIMQRNVAMRSLLGDEGPKLFTASGNDRETFRTKHVPYSALRDKAFRRCQPLENPTVAA